MSTKLVGFDESSGVVFRVLLSGDDHQSVDEALRRLFKKAFPSINVNWGTRWECGMPGDRVVVIKTVGNYLTHYLHASFSDGRTWGAA